jgi:hypothetical protein
MYARTPGMVGSSSSQRLACATRLESKRSSARAKDRWAQGPLDLARVAQAPDLLEPRDVGQFPERGVHDREARHAQRIEVEVRVQRERAPARVNQRFGQPLAFV